MIAAGTSTNAPQIAVAGAPTTISLRATVDPVPYEDRAEIKATVLATTPAVATRRPTGQVTFSVDGCISATVNLNSNGVATWRPWLCPGTRTITATYDGSERHAASDPSAPLTITVLDPDGNGPDDEDLDQINEGEPGAFFTVVSDGEASESYAQEVVPGRTGRLDAVDLAGSWVGETPPEDLQIGIYAVDEDGIPTGAPLGTGTLATADVEPNVLDIFHIDLDVPADVEGGVTYLIVLETAAQTPEAYGLWFLAGTVEDGYAAGGVLENIDGGGWVAYADPGTDLLFRTHMGDPV